MIDVTFTFNNYDFSGKLSTYNVRHALEQRVSFVALNGTEHYATQRRPIIQFSLAPLSDAEAAAVYTKLSAITANATYTDPYLGERTAQFYVASDLEQSFGLRSANGLRYYKGGVIELRQKACL